MKPAGERLSSLRKLMEKQRLAAYIVPSQDAHLSEYVADVDMRRAWLSGFTGSAGTAVVTKDKALLWTDGRYYEQAEQQLSEDWEVVRAADVGAPSVPEFLRTALANGEQVGINGDLISVAMALRWDRTLLQQQQQQSSFSHQMQQTGPLKDNAFVAVEDITRRGSRVSGSGVLLTPVTQDLVDEAWGNEQPERVFHKVKVHPVEFAGISSTSKIASLREELKSEGAHAIVFTSLDEIAWLLNLRGEDILYTPVFFSYVVVTLDKVMIFANAEAFTEEAKEQLKEELSCGEIFPYDQLCAQLETLGSAGDAEPNKKRARTVENVDAGQQVNVWLDPQCCSLTIQRCCTAAGHRIVSKSSPVRRQKAIKNEVELAGMRRAHLIEAASLCEFFAWLEKTMTSGSTKLDEVEVSDKLEEFRGSQPEYRGPSFDTISAYGSNGAIVHYKPEKKTAKQLGTNSLYLCDTGGQYLMGTTDMTRTVCFGEPSKIQRSAFTMVLEGHVRLAKACFPDAMEGAKLDILARDMLWRYGLNYKHGTSHGVGAYLGVHEYPPLMGSSLPPAHLGSGPSPTGMAAGMVLSNEPGYYLSGEFGIRIENVLVSKDVTAELPDLGIPREKDKWLGFETITFVPIDRKLIDANLLSRDALEWVNDYHAQVLEKVSPLLEERGNAEALAWLQEACKPIG